MPPSRVTTSCLFLLLLLIIEAKTVTVRPPLPFFLHQKNESHSRHLFIASCFIPFPSIKSSVCCAHFAKHPLPRILPALPACFACGCTVYGFCIVYACVRVRYCVAVCPAQRRYVLSRKKMLVDMRAQASIGEALRPIRETSWRYRVERRAHSS